MVGNIDIDDLIDDREEDQHRVDPVVRQRRQAMLQAMLHLDKRNREEAGGGGDRRAVLATMQAAAPLGEVAEENYNEEASYAPGFGGLPASRVGGA